MGSLPHQTNKSCLQNGVLLTMEISVQIYSAIKIKQTTRPHKNCWVQCWNDQIPIRALGGAEDTAETGDKKIVESRNRGNQV
mmetsp:Transcript_38959/g.45367  ORF Transcript_38959/g.45367 Transcript_38959/m.45367 type:complete len:82 (+) Transcript_38959:20-265(+)